VDTVVVDTVEGVCLDVDAVVDTLRVVVDAAVEGGRGVVKVPSVTGNGTNTTMVVVVVRRSVVVGGFVDDGLPVVVATSVEVICVFVVGNVTEVTVVERGNVGESPERCPLDFVDDGLAVVVIASVGVVRVSVVGKVTVVSDVEGEGVGESPEGCPLDVLLAEASSTYSWPGGGGGQAGREDVPTPAARARPRGPAWCLFTKRACSASMYWTEKS
jgi:hypothetical protein